MPEAAPEVIPQALLEACAKRGIKYESLSEDDKTLILRILKEYKSGGKSPTRDILYQADYREIPVSMYQFLNDPQYLGEAGIYPIWKDNLIEALDTPGRVNEIIFTGGIGIGKSFGSTAVILRKLYELICLRDPQRFYGLAPGTQIYFGLYNVLKYKAEDDNYATMMGMAQNSPYFRQFFDQNIKNPTRIPFPNSIKLVVGSNELHAAGEHLFALLIDEVNVMKKGGTQARGQAQLLYDAARRRMKSRFADKGKVPGILCMMSSRQNESSYLEKHMEEVKNDDTVRIYSYPIWQVKPKKFKKETFTVVIGDRNRSSFILKAGELVPPDLKTVEAPIDFLQDAQRDIEGFLRDDAGVATFAMRPLISHRENIYQCINKERRHPFYSEYIISNAKVEDPIFNYFDASAACNVINSVRSPKLNPGAPRYVHIDLAVSNDCCGISMGHVARTGLMRTVNHDGVYIDSVAPIICMDFMLQVRPEPGAEIDLGGIRKFIVYLRTCGFNIAKVTFDQYQSKLMMQTLANSGFEAGELSVDRDDRAYIALRDAVNESRFEAYDHKQFMWEILNIQHDSEKRKIIKPKIGGMIGHFDVVDSVAGVAYHCTTADLTAVSTFSQQEAESTKKMVAASDRQDQSDQGSIRWLVRDIKEKDQLDPDWLESIGGGDFR